MRAYMDVLAHTGFYNNASVPAIQKLRTLVPH